MKPYDTLWNFIKLCEALWNFMKRYEFYNTVWNFTKRTMGKYTLIPTLLFTKLIRSVGGRAEPNKTNQFPELSEQIAFAPTML